MNAGIPGFGLGGLFYLFSVLLMIILELIKLIQGKPVQWKFLFSILGITFGTLLSIFLTYWFLDITILKLNAGDTNMILSKIGHQAKPIVWTSLVLFILLAITRLVGSVLPAPQKK